MIFSDFALVGLFRIDPDELDAVADIVSDKLVGGRRLALADGSQNHPVAGIDAKRKRAFRIVEP